MIAVASAMIRLKLSASVSGTVAALSRRSSTRSVRSAVVLASESTFPATAIQSAFSGQEGGTSPDLFGLLQLSGVDVLLDPGDDLLAEGIVLHAGRHHPRPPRRLRPWRRPPRRRSGAASAAAAFRMT